MVMTDKSGRRGNRWRRVVDVNQGTKDTMLAK